MITGSGIVWLFAGGLAALVALMALVLYRRPVRNDERFDGYRRRVGFLYLVVGVAAVATVAIIGLPWWLVLLLGLSFAPAIYLQHRQAR